MKICSNCGTKNFETEEKCQKCGFPLRVREFETVVAIPQQNNPEQTFVVKAKKATQLQTVAIAFMILSCVISAISTLVFLVLEIVFFALSGFTSVTFLILTFVFLIFTVICIGMTGNYSYKTHNELEVGMIFKIITLLFVDIIAGMLMLCDNS